MIDEIADWQERLRGRLYEQFKDKATILGVADAFAAQVEALEGALQAIGLALSIDPVTEDAASPLYYVGRGALLDLLGKRVGEVRSGALDADYRLRLRARVRANRSSGTASDLYAVLVALFGTTLVARYLPGLSTSFVIRMDEPAIDAAEAAIAAGFIRDAKVAGVNGILEWTPTAAATAFTLGEVADESGGALLGFGDSSDYTVGGELAGAA